MTSPKRHRVGVDFHTFDGLYQGSRSHLLGLYGAAVSLAPELDFVLLSADPTRLARADPAFAGSNVECVEMPHAGGLKRLGWQLGLARRRHRIDLLHLQYRLPLWAAGPCACTVHDVLFETHPQFFTSGFVRMARWTSRSAMRRAALLFTVSRFSRDEMARLYGVDPARIAVTANAVDAARFHPPGEPGSAGAILDEQVLQAHGLASGTYLCTVGRIEPRKNHLGLLQAYARLAPPRPPLVVIGQRDFSDAPVFEAARNLKLNDTLRFLETVDDAALPVLLRHAMAFAYPSFAEGFGMPVAEAMASGVPVLTSNNTALPEVAGDAALYADPDQPEAMGRALQTLVDDAALRLRLGHAGLVRTAAMRWRPSAEVLVQALRAYFAALPP